MRPLLCTALLVGLVTLVGCDSAGSISSLDVSLANESTVPTHLLTDTEDFSPSNRVDPGLARSRRVSYRTDEADPTLTFRAGRNGVVIATVTCPVFGTTAQFVVAFTATETLSCP